MPSGSVQSPPKVYQPPRWARAQWMAAAACGWVPAGTSHPGGRASSAAAGGPAGEGAVKSGTAATTAATYCWVSR